MQISSYSQLKRPETNICARTIRNDLKHFTARYKLHIFLECKNDAVVLKLLIYIILLTFEFTMCKHTHIYM